MSNFKVLAKKYGSGGVYSEFETVNADYASSTSEGDLRFMRNDRDGAQFVAGYHRGEWISFREEK